MNRKVKVVIGIVLVVLRNFLVRTGNIEGKVFDILDEGIFRNVGNDIRVLKVHVNFQIPIDFFS